MTILKVTYLQCCSCLFVSGRTVVYRSHYKRPQFFPKVDIGGPHHRLQASHVASHVDWPRRTLLTVKPARQDGVLPRRMTTTALISTLPPSTWTHSLYSLHDSRTPLCTQIFLTNNFHYKYLQLMPECPELRRESFRQWGVCGWARRSVAARSRHSSDAVGLVGWRTRPGDLRCCEVHEQSIAKKTTLVKQYEQFTE